MLETELEDFYRGVFLPLVRRAAWKHGLSKEDAADVVQDAFLLALDKLDSSGNPKAWMTQVVDHLAMNFQRKVARRAQLAARWRSVGGAEGDEGTGSTQGSDSSEVDH